MHERTTKAARRPRLFLRAALAALLGGSLLSVTPPASAAPLPPGCAETGAATVTCTYAPGPAATFVMPADATSIHVVAVGAAGRTGQGPAAPATGGRGAVVTADLQYAPGTALQVHVATGGGAGCGAGGGASDLRTGDSFSSRVLVAAGGGGGGCSGAPASGGDAGLAGAPAGVGGGAGTGAGGGAGGSDAFGGAAGSGSFGVGGNGASGDGVFTLSGGGGGAGWYGGGGGGGGLTGVAHSGGGGGGSSLVPAGGTMGLDDSRSTGQVEITYTRTEPLPTITFTSPPAPNGAVGEPYSHQFAATGDSGITYAVTEGATPPGLTLSPSGVLSGTPTTTGTSTFTVTATGQSGASATQQNTVVVADPPEVADLSVALSASPNPVRSGSPLTYTAVVRNAGPDAATDAVLVDTLPSAARFSSLSAPAGWTCDAPPAGTTGTIVCTTPELAPGATASFTIVVTVVSSGKTTVSNRADVTSAADDPQAANNTATVTTSVQGRR